MEHLNKALGAPRAALAEIPKDELKIKKG